MPVVVDLDGDQLPEVVFISSAPGSELGVLRAVRGTDGREIFSVADPQFPLYAGGGLAAGDIDGDARPEIVALRQDRMALVVFEHDGSHKWSAAFGSMGNLSYPALADVDHDGQPEIAIAETLLNGDGSTRWQHDLPPSGGDETYLVDLDLSGGLELVCGVRAFSSDGALYWQAGPTASFSAVADIDADPYPEVIVAGASGDLYALEHDGGVKWGPVRMPGPLRGRLGPITIADVDADGSPEIGIGSGSNYSVVETDGSIKWTVPVEGNSFPGASAADLDGDGAAEILFQDLGGLTIFRGSDGAILWQMDDPEFRSHTWLTAPVVADVDADGHAEIIATATDARPFAPDVSRLRVFGNDAWMPTRPVWNQHSYHITNVLDDGTIPQFEPNNWATHNNFRANEPLSGVRRHRAYFPVTLGEQIQIVRRHADVVLVVDTSESMTGYKLAAAQAAMREFVGHLSFPDDRVALVTFNRTARLVQSLTDDKTGALAALAQLDTAPGTRIDAGLRIALDELIGPTHRDGVTRAIILLTDGRQEADLDAPHRLAAEALSADVSLFVIGLGADVSEDYLKGLAGASNRYYFAPDPSALAAIYTAIARTIPCRPEDYWGQRCP